MPDDMKFYRCKAKRKCGSSPCPVCHNQGPCAHCNSGERARGCRHLETYVAREARPRPDRTLSPMEEAVLRASPAEGAR